MKRFYCPQAWTFQGGWVDLPSLASLQEKAANDAAKFFSSENNTLTRVIRKPKGWSPVPEIPKLKIRVTKTVIPGPPEKTPEKTQSPPLQESGGEDLPRLLKEAHSGDKPAAVRAARLLRRNQQVEDLLQLTITAFYMGWKDLFENILRSNSAADNTRVWKFILDSANEEMKQSYYSTLGVKNIYDR